MSQNFHCTTHPMEYESWRCYSCAHVPKIWCQWLCLLCQTSIKFCPYLIYIEMFEFMHFFLFIPYVIFILCRWNCKMVHSHGRTAAAIIVTFLLTSWVVSALISLKFNYTHKIAEPLESFGYLYEKPWTRLGPYVMGKFNHRNWQYLWLLFLWHRPLT